MGQHVCNERLLKTNKKVPSVGLVTVHGLQLPVVVELKVTQCDPGVRGNSATGRTKPATLETGLVVHVPEYLAEGEMVKVDTRSGEFLSRV